MKEKAYEPADTNDNAPAKGMASVNTFNPEEQANGNDEALQKNIHNDDPQKQETTKENDK